MWCRGCLRCLFQEKLFWKSNTDKAWNRSGRALENTSEPLNECLCNFWKQFKSEKHDPSNSKNLDPNSSKWSPGPKQCNSTKDPLISVVPPKTNLTTFAENLARRHSLYSSTNSHNVSTQQYFWIDWARCLKSLTYKPSHHQFVPKPSEVRDSIGFALCTCALRSTERFEL